MMDVGIENLKPGMVLENPVKNSQGVLLLDAGARITKKSIRIFKSWGVTEATVKGGGTRANGTTGPLEPRIKGSDEMLLKEKFTDVLDDPVMVEIFNAANRQLNKALQNTESKDEH